MRGIALSAAVLLGCLLLLFAAPGNATILALSPHPDDDAALYSGVIYRANAAGEPVYVVFMTNGDLNGVSTGYMRQGEAVAGQGYQLTPENRCIFLGYPDAYMMILYTSYLTGGQYTTPNGQSTTYGNRGLGSADYHTYKFGAAAAYNFAYVVADLTQIIKDVRPDHILTTALSDEHPDHQATYLALRLALQAAMPTMPGYSPTVHRMNTWWSSNDWPLPMDPSRT